MGSRANSAIVLALGAAVVVVVVEGNEGVEGEVPRWDIAVAVVEVVAGDGWIWIIETSLDWAVLCEDGEDG